MKHPEWFGNNKLILKLLKKANLDDNELSNQRRAMRTIIVCRYIEFMSVDETLALLANKYNIYVSERTYYRLLNRAINLMK